MKSKDLLKIFSPNLPKTKKELELIKRKFLLKHVKYESIEEENISNVNFSDTSILVKTVIGSSSSFIEDELGFKDEIIDLEHDLIKVDFKDEFKEELSFGLEIYCSKFRSMLDKKSIYTVDMLEGFKRSKLENINKLIKYYSTISDLPDFFKDLIIAFYNDFYNYISAFSLEEIQISDKLKFKLTKSQVILLFHTMLEKKVISGITPNDLNRILNEKTMYSSNDSYIDMKDAGRQANKFQKGHALSSPSLNKLSSIFNKTFFTSSE
jgi:hypothetical protein